MSTWLYQLNPREWSPETFRFEIWEGKQWRWGYGVKRGTEELQVGDTLIFFYAKSGGNDPGIYGWAVLENHNKDERLLYFLPAAPTNHLKMDPCWGDEIRKLTDEVRGEVKRATLFCIDFPTAQKLRSCIRHWLAGKH
jgi:hypothetical protein